MLDDDFMDELLDETLHLALPRGWVQFKGDRMVIAIREKYGLDEQSGEAQLSEWLASRGGGVEWRVHDSGLPAGAKIRTADSTARYLVAFLPDSAVPAASPRAAAKL